MEHLLAAFVATTPPLVLPSDERARAVAEALLANPADPRDLHDHAVDAATSATHLRRLFRSETGLTFTEWRTEARMQAARTLLEEGHRVAGVARAVGYRSTSSFVRAFHRHSGYVPGAVATGEGPGLLGDLASPAWTLRHTLWTPPTPAPSVGSLSYSDRHTEQGTDVKPSTKAPLLAAAIMLFSAACAADGVDDDAASADSEAAATGADPTEVDGTDADGAVTEAQTFVDSLGREVSVPAAPQRIIPFEDINTTPQRADRHECGVGV